MIEIINLLWQILEVLFELGLIAIAVRVLCGLIRGLFKKNNKKQRKSRYTQDYDVEEEDWEE